jgi:Uma2 family endonuclease
LRYFAVMATQPDYRLLTAEDFLEIDFGEQKAELDNGVIRMMAGGTARHSSVQGNVFGALLNKLRGSGCRPYTSDMAARTRFDSIRYPDVSVYCGRDTAENDEKKAFDDPRVVIEVLSKGTARTDLNIKLIEYRALPSVDTIIFVDIGTERLRVVQRTGKSAWTEVSYDEPADVDIPTLNITLTHDEIFARG